MASGPGVLRASASVGRSLGTFERARRASRKAPRSVHTVLDDDLGFVGTFQVRVGNEHSLEVDFDVPRKWYRDGEYATLVTRDEVLARVWRLFNHDVASYGLSSSQIEALVDNGCVGLASTPGQFWNDEADGGYAWNGYRTMLRLVTTYFGYVVDGEVPSGESTTSCAGMSGMSSDFFLGDGRVEIIVHGTEFASDEGATCHEETDPGWRFWESGHSFETECSPCADAGYDLWPMDDDAPGHTPGAMVAANPSDLYTVDWTVGTDWTWRVSPSEMTVPPVVELEAPTPFISGSAAYTNHDGAPIHMRADLIAKRALVADWLLHWAHVAVGLAEVARLEGRPLEGLSLETQADYLGRYALTSLLGYGAGSTLVHELAHYVSPRNSEHINSEERCCSCTIEEAFRTGVAARLGLALDYTPDVNWACVSGYARHERNCSDDTGQFQWSVVYTAPCEARGDRQFSSWGCSRRRLHSPSTVVVYAW